MAEQAARYGVARHFGDFAQLLREQTDCPYTPAAVHLPPAVPVPIDGCHVLSRAVRVTRAESVRGSARVTGQTQS
jgi:hypothetical protein